MVVTAPLHISRQPEAPHLSSPSDISDAAAALAMLAGFASGDVSSVGTSHCGVEKPHKTSTPVSVKTKAEQPSVKPIVKEQSPCPSSPELPSDPFLISESRLLHRYKGLCCEVSDCFNLAQITVSRRTGRMLKKAGKRNEFLCQKHTRLGEEGLLREGRGKAKDDRGVALQARDVYGCFHLVYGHYISKKWWFEACDGDSCSKIDFSKPVVFVP